MKIKNKFLIVFLVAFAITIIPNLFIIRGDVLAWLPFPFWTALSILRFIVLLGLFVVVVHLWIIKPLNLIAKSLSLNDPDLVNDIARRRDEIGRIGVLLQQFFKQTKELTSVIADNSKALEEVAKSEAQLKKSKIEITHSLNKQLEANRLKSQFISLVSHEFRTPLAAISSNIQLLHRYEDKWPHKKKTVVLKRIQEGIQIMINLLEEITLLSRDHSGRLFVYPEEFQLNHFILDLITELKKNSELPLNLELHVNEKAALITSDKEFLRQILSHLIINACKFNPEKNPVNVKITRDNNHIEIEIVDQGIGIPHGDLEHIWEPFIRGQNSGDYPGSGLGLAIVKRCVDLLEGSIQIRSTENAGTNVEVKLPVKSTIINRDEHNSSY